MLGLKATLSYDATYRYNDFSSYYSSYILRPFEVMLKLRIKLL